jgi:hypothetical protein
MLLKRLVARGLSWREFRYAHCRFTFAVAFLSGAITLRCLLATRGDDMTVTDNPVSQTRRVNLARLEGLAEVLAGRGLRARVVAPPGRVPSVHVVNPQASALAEDVYAGRGQDGRWWFWWSWAEQIAVGDDLEGAAARIGRVLASGR